MLLLYVLLTTLYSFWLKRKLLLDVFFLAGLYTHRVLAGGQAAEVEVSKWLLAFSIFFFLSLAFAKRYAELLRWSDENTGNAQVRGRAYRVEDLEVMNATGSASGYLSVLVLALYVNQSELVPTLYKSPSLLWLLCPVMLYWITRIWFFARRRSLTEDPILFALKDRVSLMTAGVVMLLLVLATVGVPGVR
jgi:4-hydroxybenzoate polyprenyltransferase